MDAESAETGLRTEEIAYAGLAEIEAAPDADRKAEAFAGVVFDIFNDYYRRSRRIPWLAKEAFETRDWPRSVRLSHERIEIFGEAIRQAVPILSLVMREADRKGGFWNTVEERFRQRVAERYERDLALAFLSSLRRWVYKDVWAPVGYGRHEAPAGGRAPSFVERMATDGRMTPDLVARILALPQLRAPFRDLEADAVAVAERINRELGLDQDPRLGTIDMVQAGFYRNRGAYVVGGMEVGSE